MRGGSCGSSMCGAKQLHCGMKAGCPMMEKAEGMPMDKAADVKK
jgi:hypothetical protein